MWFSSLVTHLTQGVMVCRVNCYLFHTGDVIVVVEILKPAYVGPTTLPRLKSLR